MTDNNTQKKVSFNDYKNLKDEIVAISELRFENILTKRLKSFKKEFKHELLDELDPRFDAIDARFNAIDARFDGIDARFQSMNAQFDARFQSIDANFKAVDTRFNSVEKRLSFLTWFLPLLLTVLFTVFRII